VKKLILSSLLILVALSPFSNSFPKATLEQKPARLAVFNFLNETPRKDISYLGSSIAETIILRMNENFIFQLPNRERNQKLADVLLTSSTSFNPKDLDGLCYTAGIDYAVFGNYRKKSETEILIHAGIYSIAEKKIITEAEKIVSTDSTMFTEIEALSDEFIGSLYLYTAAQMKIKAKKDFRLDVKETAPIVKQPVAAKPVTEKAAPVIPPKNFHAVFGQAFGYAIAGSINYEYTALPWLSLGAGIGLFPAENIYFKSGTLFAGFFWHNAVLRTGPYIISGITTGFGVQSTVGYLFNFGRRRYFAEPDATLLWTNGSFYPFFAISAGVRF